MDATTPTWRIRLLGGLRAERIHPADSPAVTRFRSRKTAALLAYLAYYGGDGRPHSREGLAERFWPEVAPEDGRNGLRVALASLRKDLSDDLFDADRAAVRLAPGAFTCDVAEFEDALSRAEQERRRGDDGIEAARLGDAAALYGGRLLPGHYDDWALVEGERLHERHAQALDRLCALLTRAGDLPGALDAARRLVAADPLCETYQLRLVGLLRDAGRPADALRQWDEMAATLRRETDSAPSAEARKLRDAVRAAAEAGSPAPGPEPPPPLPDPLTRFFGREEELARLAELLAEGGPRAVTVFGPGGTGKTRLALEAARAALRAGAFTDAWFAPLEEVTDAARLPDALRDALRLPRVPHAAPFEQVTARLSAVEGGRPLLILDNLEQIADAGAAADWIARLLREVPGLVCLLTSRRRLGVPGESLFAADPLPVPEKEEGGSPRRSLSFLLPPSSLLRLPSVALFVDRAQAVQPGFALSATNADDVAGLVARLEGVPLALELAAAWAHVLSPAEMLARMGSEPFDLLASRRGDKESRHRSLFAAIRWSYDLLPGDLKDLFVRLSVFRGGFPAEAAAEVCGGDVAEVRDRLGRLRERSLVRSGEGAGGAMRFSLLESLREFGQEALYDDERRRLGARHADWLLRRAEANPTDNARGLRGEADNLRAAVAFHGADPTPEGARAHLKLLARTWTFWAHEGLWREGRALLDAALARASSLPECRDARLYLAEAQNGAGGLAYFTGDFPAARRLFAAAATAYEGLGDPECAARTWANLASVAMAEGDTAAAIETQEQKCLPVLRTGGERTLVGLGNSLLNLSQLYNEFGDPEDRAEPLAREALEAFRAAGHANGAAAALLGLGNVLAALNRGAEAAPLYEEALTAFEAQGDALRIADVTSRLAGLRLDSGEPAEAERLYRDALRRFAAIGSDWGASTKALPGLAQASLLVGRGPNRAERAALLWGWSEAQWARRGSDMGPKVAEESTKLRAEVDAVLGPERSAVLFTEGAALPFETAVRIGLGEK